MDYMQDIMSRLQKGESVEDIAAQITKDINAANAAFQEKKAKLEPKIKAARAALDALADFYELYAGSDDIVVTGLRELDAEDVINDIEKEWPVIELMLGLSKESNPKPRAKSDGKSAADPIEEFLNKFVRN